VVDKGPNRVAIIFCLHKTIKETTSSVGPTGEKVTNCHEGSTMHHCTSSDCFLFYNREKVSTGSRSAPKLQEGKHAGLTFILAHGIVSVGAPGRGDDNNRRFFFFEEVIIGDSMAGVRVPGLIYSLHFIYTLY